MCVIVLTNTCVSALKPSVRYSMWQQFHRNASQLFFRHLNMYTRLFFKSCLVTSVKNPPTVGDSPERQEAMKGLEKAAQVKDVQMFCI